jgi:hypothetical protein
MRPRPLPKPASNAPKPPLTYAELITCMGCIFARDQSCIKLTSRPPLLRTVQSAPDSRKKSVRPIVHVTAHPAARLKLRLAQQQARDRPEPPARTASVHEVVIPLLSSHLLLHLTSYHPPPTPPFLSPRTMPMGLLQCVTRCRSKWMPIVFF